MAAINRPFKQCPRMTLLMQALISRCLQIEYHNQVLYSQVPLLSSLQSPLDRLMFAVCSLLSATGVFCLLSTACAAIVVLINELNSQSIASKAMRRCTAKNYGSFNDQYV